MTFLIGVIVGAIVSLGLTNKAVREANKLINELKKEIVSLEEIQNHGKWKVIENDRFTTDVQCTACSKTLTIIGDRLIPMNYCPNCGAVMDAEKEES